MTLLEKLDRIPPCACRLVARRRDGKSWVGLSHREIAHASGLKKSTVAKLSFLRTWVGVPADVIQAFALACGVNHLQSQKVLEFLRRRQMVHTVRGPRQQVEMYTKLLELWAVIIQEERTRTNQSMPLPPVSSVISLPAHQSTASTARS